MTSIQHFIERWLFDPTIGQLISSASVIAIVEIKVKLVESAEASPA